MKRLAASVAIAGRINGLGATKRRDAVVRALASYRATMARLSGISVLEVWYLEIEAPALRGKGAFARDVGRTVKRASVKDSRHAFSKFTEVVDGRWRFRSEPPLLLQAASDVFLGWAHDQDGRDCAALQDAVRQGRVQAQPTE